MKFNSGNDFPRESKATGDGIDYEQLSEMLDDCLIHLALFNAWEESFINDMVVRVERRDPLTPRQRETIESCHNKVTRRRR